MKLRNVALVCSLSALSASGVSVSVDKVQQRYPWNGIVDIDYSIALAAGEKPLSATEDGLRFTCTDRVSGTVTACWAFPETLPSVEAGAHRLAWNANADGLTVVSTNIEIAAEIVHHPVRYLVVDVSGGPTATSYPVTVLAGAPPGGFDTDEYKTSKIVLRSIPAGSFRMGSTAASDPERPNAAREVAHNVSISQPFYMGLFEVTQAQYANVKTLPAVSYVGETRPVISVSYNTIRGSSLGAQWPTNDQVDATSFVGLLRAKTGKVFDLPTEAQWEYACRAGTSTPFNDGVVHAGGNTYGGSVDRLGRYSGNVSEGRGGYAAGTTTVGLYEPNAWGLYDMHGNVFECCRDWFVQDLTTLGRSVDPVGPDANTPGWENRRVWRGGCYSSGASFCRSAYRYNYDNNNNTPDRAVEYAGFRLAAVVGETEVAE